MDSVRQNPEQHGNASGLPLPTSRARRPGPWGPVSVACSVVFGGTATPSPATLTFVRPLIRSVTTANSLPIEVRASVPDDSVEYVDFYATYVDPDCRPSDTGNGIRDPGPAAQLLKLGRDTFPPFQWVMDLTTTEDHCLGRMRLHATGLTVSGDTFRAAVDSFVIDRNPGTRTGLHPVGKHNLARGETPFLEERHPHARIWVAAAAAACALAILGFALRRAATARWRKGGALPHAGSEGWEPGSTPASPRQAEVLVQNMLTTASRRLNDPGFNLRVLAKEMQRNPNHLSNLFQRETGRRFTDHLVRLRLERADSFLKDTTRSITDIALECGFNSPVYFARAYRRRYGYAPSEARGDITDTAEER